MRSRVLIGTLATFAFFVGLFSACAEEPFFKKGDVIALVGGEDMVAMSEYGYLELLLTRALPEHHLKFRNLAWEGDTVFEQRRDLNFPPLEAQLEQVGATVVLCQFGQMESLAGKEKLPEFVAAYEKLIAQMSGGRGKRRVVILSPHRFENAPLNWNLEMNAETWRIDLNKTGRNENAAQYVHQIRALADKSEAKFLNLFPLRETDDTQITRDGVHLDGTISEGHGELARETARQLGVAFEPFLPLYDDPDLRSVAWTLGRPGFQLFELSLKTIRAKNRLWFDYWRVQNWAFLAGDRTEQPSSRDHVDRTKRWFPAEREQFLPLIEAKEQEIWTLAAKLAQP